MNPPESWQAVAASMDMAPIVQEGQWLQELESEINRLLVDDFDRLISILYRMDVSEVKLKRLLKENPVEDAARIISALMIERQAEKLKSRQQSSGRDKALDDEEKW
ncbi:MAG: hypothetical protein H7Y42_05620 [Chitinophagaceae bacterium]|nr:hypothetical protein [Chitinophagaceae bacterium]